MWKIVVGFVLFAALSMYVIITAGDKADMGGEKHGADAVHAPRHPPAQLHPQPPPRRHPLQPLHRLQARNKHIARHEKGPASDCWQGLFCRVVTRGRLRRVSA